MRGPWLCDQRCSSRGVSSKFFQYRCTQLAAMARAYPPSSIQGGADECPEGGYKHILLKPMILQDPMQSLLALRSKKICWFSSVSSEYSTDLSWRNPNASLSWTATSEWHNPAPTMCSAKQLQRRLILRTDLANGRICCLNRQWKCYIIMATSDPHETLPQSESEHTDTSSYAPRDAS